jgi:hypothetical protein
MSRLVAASSFAVLVTALVVTDGGRVQAAVWQFTDVSAAAGANVVHSIATVLTPPQKMCAGVACGDYDNDGWVDLYHLGGNLGTNHLLRNNGDGTFTDVAATAGVNVSGSLCIGATFADWSGDGWLDLIMGGDEGTRLKLFESNGDGTFRQVTDSAGVSIAAPTYSASFGDTDRDDDLDLVIAHWGTGQAGGHFWRNDGDAGFSTRFTSADTLWGYVSFPIPPADWTFAYNFGDLNGDEWTDVVVASDFRTSHVYLNDGDGTFTDATDPQVITDDNGMGTCLGDYDNDGDLDWFVSSIYDTSLGLTGNRLYENDGTGVFADVTEAAGVRHGYWGWGAVMQDLNNDGWLDIFHTNGWSTAQWLTTPDLLFVADGNGATFTESAAALGVDDPGQGRGVACFDYDRDGDLDLFIAKTDQPATLYRNDGGNSGNWLDVKLVGASPNVEEIGARIRATAGGTTQTRELRAGNNFSSQDPAEAHFGLGPSTTVDELEIRWTDGSITTMSHVPANQRLVIDRTAATSALSPGDAGISRHRASPNPSGTGTRIEFALGEAGRTSVRVYDAAGRAVRTLADRRFSPGADFVVWDGRDGSGLRVPSGVYFYEIRAGRGRVCGKVAVVR